MSAPLEGRTAIVTGSSRGIGKAIALQLAAEGADVVVCARSLQSTPELPGSIGETAEAIRAMGRRAFALKVDVLNDEDLNNLVAETQRAFGRIDILVNNAGLLHAAPFLGAGLDDLEAAWQMNVRAPVLLTQIAAPVMIAGGGGVVVNISSGLARHSRPPEPGAPAGRPNLMQGYEYGMTKAALDRFSTGVAGELGARNVSAISIWPGFTVTERVLQRDPSAADREDAQSMETTAKAVAFLCRDPMQHNGRILASRTVCEENGL